jgi:hypothetical protein
VLLHHASAGDTSIFNNAPVAVLLAVLLPDGPPQKHGGSLSGTPHPEMPKVFTTAVFGQFSALHPRHINGLAHGKNLKIAKTMGESAKIG